VFELARYRVVVRGGGDLASGAVCRLVRAGFRVAVLELDAPMLVRRSVCYGEAVFSGACVVEGITAHRSNVEDAEAVMQAGAVPVIVDAGGASLSALRPDVLVDARMEKRNLGTRMADAPVVIALGPGFCAGEDCHAVIETNRGHFLGRAIYQGSAEPDTGEPGSIGSHTHTRVLRAPADGHVTAYAAIGDLIEHGAQVAMVGGQPVLAPFRGMLRGIIHERVAVRAGTKIGDLDPRAQREHCFTISDKSFSVGGGVLEAALHLLVSR
jgi:xanthine dehydrogenase accessory factor